MIGPPPSSGTRHDQARETISRRDLLKAGAAVATGLFLGRSACPPNPATAGPATTRPLKITRGAAQLFVELDHVERLENVRQLFHTADKHPANPVLKGERPWEAQAYAPTASFIYDEQQQVFKVWYMGLIGDRAGPRHSYGPHVLCYAESTDGIEWVRPELGLHEHGDSKQNNIVIPQTYHEGKDHWESVLKDPLDSDPQRRYKAIGWSSHSTNKDGAWCGSMGECGIYSMTSPDGLHWTHSKEPIFHYRPRPGTDDLGPVGDAHSLMIDTQKKRYVAFLRSETRLYSTSEDFVHWSKPATSLEPLSGHGGATLYNHLGFPYGDQYLGVVSYFHNNAAHEYKLDVRLLSSRDGIRYRMPGPAPESRPALIPCGDIGEWDRLQTRLTGGPPLRVGEKLHFYYRGFSTSHDKAGSPTDTYYAGAIGLATLRLDGFASLAAGFDGGRITTKPLLFEGAKLLLNVKADHYAQVMVEILDAEGRPIPGYSLAEGLPITENRVDAEARGKSGTDLAPLTGRPVRLRFHLTNARLYAYRIV